MGVVRISAVAAALAIGLGGAAAMAQQQQQQGGDKAKTLMEERQGAIGTGDQPPKPAEQNSGMSGATSGGSNPGNSASGGSLQFGSQDKGQENSLPAQRQGTIGTQEKPPEPTTQGGSK